jgi:hypothetical protein
MQHVQFATPRRRLDDLVHLLRHLVPAAALMARGFDDGAVAERCIHGQRVDRDWWCDICQPNKDRPYTFPVTPENEAGVDGYERRGQNWYRL